MNINHNVASLIRMRLQQCNTFKMRKKNIKSSGKKLVCVSVRYICSQEKEILCCSNINLLKMEVLFNH